MGGYGSGRNLDAKSVTSSYLCIDAAHLKKQGALDPGCEFILRFEAQNAEVAGEAEDTIVWFNYSIRKGDEYEDQYYHCLSRKRNLTASEYGFTALTCNVAGECVNYISHSV